MFGDQTVTFVALVKTGEDRNNEPIFTRNEVAVTGCRFRPLRVNEKVGVTDIATEVWKCTAPPVAAVLNAEAISELKYLGETYQLLGEVSPFTDFSSVVHKVTVLAQKQSA